MAPKYMVLIVAVVAGALVGIAVAVWQASRKAKPGNPEESESAQKTFEELLRQSLTTEYLEGAELSRWFREQSARHEGRMEGLLVYATKKNISGIGYACPSKLEEKSYVLQMLLQKDKYDLLAVRLINFRDIHPELRRDLDSGGYKVDLP